MNILALAQLQNVVVRKIIVRTSMRGRLGLDILTQNSTKLRQKLSQLLTVLPQNGGECHNEHFTQDRDNELYERFIGSSMFFN